MKCDPSHPPGIGLLPARQSSSDLTGNLHAVYELIRARYPFLERVALALYDPGTDLLKTFISSNADEVLLKRYEVKLSQVPSLATLAQRRESRLVHDIAVAFGTQSTHSAWLVERGYRASYTRPVFQGDELAGFLFFDAKEVGAFTEDVARFLDGFADIVAQLFLLQRRVVDGVLSTVKVAVGLASLRDLETGQHLDRMAHYARLMGRALAERHDLSDEYIEYLFLFAPLHDIGKVGIPDRILLKPGRLDADEWTLMKEHVRIGEEIIGRIRHEVGGGDSLAGQVMHNIVAGHHERGDGSGYPRGLVMAQIPLEARIVAVADVYDALSSRRVYKDAWGEAQVQTEMLREVAAGRLDGECVAALLDAAEARAAVLAQFREEAEL